MFSDLHLHAFKQFSKEEVGGVNSRLKDGLDIIKQIEEHVQNDTDITDVFFCGDLFHVRNNINVATFNKVIESVTDFAYNINKVKLYILAGNHDQATRDGEVTSLDAFQSISVRGGKKIPIIKSPTNVPHKYLDIVAAPYTENKDSVKKLIKGKHDLFFGHMGINGSIVGSDFVYNNPADWSLDDLNTHNFDALFFGHFHRHQQLTENSWYVGAPLHHNFGDEGQSRGFMVYDVNTKRAEHLPTRYPKFVTVTDETIDDKEFHNNYVRIKTANRSLYENIEQDSPKGYEFVDLDKKKETKKTSKFKTSSISEAIKEYVSKLDIDSSINKEYLYKKAIAYLEKNS